MYRMHIWEERFFSYLLQQQGVESLLASAYVDMALAKMPVAECHRAKVKTFLANFLLDQDKHLAKITRTCLIRLSLTS
jgi:hypothetical protein